MIIGDSIILNHFIKAYIVKVCVDKYSCGKNMLKAETQLTLTYSMLCL